MNANQRMQWYGKLLAMPTTSYCYVPGFGNERPAGDSFAFNRFNISLDYAIDFADVNRSNSKTEEKTVTVRTAPKHDYWQVQGTFVPVEV